VIGEVASVLTVGAVLGGSLRWLRIAQREHYLPGSVSRFAIRWWRSRPANIALGAILIGSTGAAWVGWWQSAIAAGVISLAAPFGLSYRGRSSKLAWTRRLRTLATVTAFFIIAIGAFGICAGVPAGVSATLAACAPAIVDFSLFVTTPLERRLSARFVTAASRRLQEISPRVVAITGSYGKTSTKSYTGHLLRAKYTTLTSPASFNNTAGLARTINERLTSGTEVFVAEMGTYGPGEIRSLCRWINPEIAVITALGPVHLERMGSISNIARAKAEILEGAKMGVVNVDNPHLSAIATDYRQQGGRLISCSTADPSADVYVDSEGTTLTLSVRGQLIGTAEVPGVFPGNLACAVGVALAADIPVSEIFSRLTTLPTPEHRQAVQTTTSGVIVIDDTFNSNPAGARAALQALAAASVDGRRVVVTPGMVELGREQGVANETFARQASALASDILIVGRTNQRALQRGAVTGSARIVISKNRPDAVAWVRRNLSSGDAVLYENDLPDHYP
jgi:UDP-N-acetylmuramoyl-tripeptide--D-alanyl-D-alanine ligase